ncbi:MAG: alpha/beta hydrolase family esterase [Planctomycetota bacterium]
MKLCRLSLIGVWRRIRLLILVLAVALLLTQIHQRRAAAAREDESTAAAQLGPGDHTRRLRVGSMDRRYLVHIPQSCDGKQPSPVVLVFHGGGGNPSGMVQLCGMNAKADQAGFIVVYPYGTGRLDNSLLTFNGGECCGYAKDNGIDDVGFTKALLDDLAKVVNVDADRVYATGLSNGGIMSHRLASELSDRIAAIAPVGGPLMLETLHNDRAVSVMQFHGTKDEHAPYAGGFGKGFLGRNGITKFRSVESTMESWVRANGCNVKPAVTMLPDQADDGMRVTRKTWSGGRSGSEVVLIEIEGGGHTWPGRHPVASQLGESTMDISANDLMWEFFQRHPRTGAAQTQTRAKP